MNAFRGRHYRQTALAAVAIFTIVFSTVLLTARIAEAGPGEAPSAVLTEGIGGTVQRVQVMSETSPSSTSSTTWVTFARMVVRVPAEERAMFLARFSAESACSGGVGSQWCGVRIRLSGAEMNPVVGNDFAFDSTNNGNETSASWESHAIERWSRTVNPGTYVVEVQRRVTNSAVTLRLDDWTLAVERVQIISP